MLWSSTFGTFGWLWLLLIVFCHGASHGFCLLLCVVWWFMKFIQFLFGRKTIRHLPEQCAISHQKERKEIRMKSFKVRVNCHTTFVKLCKIHWSYFGLLWVCHGASRGFCLLSCEMWRFVKFIQLLFVTIPRPPQQCAINHQKERKKMRMKTFKLSVKYCKMFENNDAGDKSSIEMTSVSSEAVGAWVATQMYGAYFRDLYQGLTIWNWGAADWAAKKLEKFF